MTIAPDYNLPSYSQNGQNEDRIAAAILKAIGIQFPGFLVDIGAHTKHGSNTRLFMEMGYEGLRIDGEIDKDFPDIQQHWITKDNIVSIFEDNKVPERFDLMSIDIDGNDFWITLEILNAGYQPALIVAEINPKWNEHESYAIEYNEKHRFNSNDYYGMSYAALKKLGELHGYTPVYISHGINAFLLKDEYLKFITPDVKYTKKQDWPKAGGKWRAIV